MPEDPALQDRLPADEDEAGGAVPASWWRDGVLYQIYPRSFADSDGDGSATCAGIIARLDHLEWLGVDGIWLNPIIPRPTPTGATTSPTTAPSHPDLGTLEDLDALDREAGGRRGIRVLLDLVPNHTSDRHPWFLDAAQRPRRPSPRLVRVGRPGARRRAAQQLDLRASAARAWTLRRADRPVLPAQLPRRAARPELVERGGARRVRRDPALLVRRAGSPASGSTSATRSSRTASCATTRRPTPGDHPQVRAPRPAPGLLDEPARGARRAAALARGRRRGRTRRGSWSARPTCSTSTRSIPFYGAATTSSTWRSTSSSSSRRPRADAAARRSSRAIEAMLPDGRVAGVDRLQPRRRPADHALGAGRRPRRARAALLMLLTLRGTPFLYYGDEIGLPDVPLDPATALDPVGAARRPGTTATAAARRCPGRASPAAGSRARRASRGCRFGDLGAHNVADQRDDPGSMLRLIARPDRAAARARGPPRRRLRDARPRPDGAWAWRARRGHRGGAEPLRAPVTVGGIAGTVLAGTDRGARRGGVRRRALAPWEGVVVALADDRSRRSTRALGRGLAVRARARRSSPATRGASTRSSAATR